MLESKIEVQLRIINEFEGLIASCHRGQLLTLIKMLIGIVLPLLVHVNSFCITIAIGANSHNCSNEKKN